MDPRHNTGRKSRAGVLVNTPWTEPIVGIVGIGGTGEIEDMLPPRFRVTWRGLPHKADTGRLLGAFVEDHRDPPDTSESPEEFHTLALAMALVRCRCVD